MHPKRTTDALTCAHCGTTFPYKQSGTQAHRFCSWECLQASRTPETRFWAKVQKDGPVPEACPERGPCWIWTGALFSDSGYGQFWQANTNRRAHIVSYEWAYGPITDGRQVQHLCNVRICVRPSHLVLGTPAENTQYAVRFGRMAHGDRHWLKTRPDHRQHARGAQNGTAVLTENDILEIRSLKAEGWSQHAIAVAKHVSDSTISHILRGTAWKHVT